MEISQFVKKQDRETERIKQFYDIVKHVKTKQERRKIEMKLLKPTPIPVYIGKKAGRSRFQKCSLRLVFKNSNLIKRLSKFITINTYVENNSFDTEMFISFVDMLESGEMIWDKENKKFILHSVKNKRKNK